MNIYTDEGWLDFRKIAELGYPFNFIYGPRGVGKTYGGLLTTVEDKIPFMYSRRLQSELDLINKEDYFPFKRINADKDWHIGIKTVTKYNSGFYQCVKTDEGWKPEGQPIGYTSALSTFGHIRGFDASDLKRWIYDEFIPEETAHSLKGEGQAFMNAYETMNRNRELAGEKPMQVFCLANSNRLANPIFMELGLVNYAQEMKRKGWNYKLLPDRGIALFDTFDSPISERKEDTALYRLANKDSDFYRMAISNQFADLDAASTRPRNLSEYVPVVGIGELTIYSHKTDHRYYVSMHRSGSPEVYGTSDINVTRFLRKYSHLWMAYLRNMVDFEDYMSEALFNRYLNT